ncbi:unnamed protein product [Calicophoron daubneyi]|uniref:Major facilitator superfamily (MFS) profile domain-containing protein n=1 Tax=Calicophoron daubneyi TaxID=300641 RepID=A0AAV2THJ7_CALDB
MYDENVSAELGSSISLRRKSTTNHGTGEQLTEETIINADELMENIIHPFGPWQWSIAFLLMFSVCSPMTFPVYANSASPHRCRMEPEIELYISEHNFSFTEVASRIGPWMADGNLTFSAQQRGCSRYKLNWTSIVLDQVFAANTDFISGSIETERCPLGYVHELSKQHYPGNVVKEFETVCDRSWLVPLGTSLYLLGMSVGFLAGGWGGGKFGRKKALLCFCLLEFAGAVWTSLSPNYFSYVIARSFMSIGNIARITIGGVLMLELTVARYRSIFNSILSFGINFFYRGLMALWAFLIPNWRLLNVAVMAPNLLSILCIFYLPESPRWLLSKNLFEEALEVLKHACRINNPRDSLKGEKELENIFRGVVRTEISLPKSLNSVDITAGKPGFRPTSKVKHSYLKETILGIEIMAFMSFCFTGFLFYTRTLRSYVYLVGFLNALFALPANLLYATIYRCTRYRKRPLMILILFAGIILAAGSIYTVVFKPETDVVLIVSTNLSLVLTNASIAMLFLYIPELFPSEIRTQRLGLIMGVSRIFAMMCTFVNELDFLWGHGVPLLFYSAALGLLFLSLAFMRDTSGENLPDVSHIPSR